MTSSSSRERVLLAQIARDQALVCEKWKLIQSNMTIDKALHAFLTQKLDVSGQTITFLAFEHVQQVLCARVLCLLATQSTLRKV